MQSVCCRFFLLLHVINRVKSFHFKQMHTVLSKRLHSHFRKLTSRNDLFMSIEKFNFLFSFSVIAFTIEILCVSFTINLIMHSTMVSNGIIYSLLKKKEKYLHIYGVCVWVSAKNHTRSIDVLSAQLIMPTVCAGCYIAYMSIVSLSVRGHNCRMWKSHCNSVDSMFWAVIVIFIEHFFIHFMHYFHFFSTRTQCQSKVALSLTQKSIEFEFDGQFQFKIEIKSHPIQLSEKNKVCVNLF